MSKISVIIPVYRAEAYLTKCLDSVIAACKRVNAFCGVECEIILIDDKSPDDCGIICDEYSRMFSDIIDIIVIHQKHKGVSAARNVGLDKAEGEYIAFVDSDDYVHQDYLYKLFSSIKENSTDLAICNVQPVYEDPSDKKFEYYFREIDKVFDREQAYYELCTTNGNLTIGCNKLYSTSLFSNLRYPVGSLHEDTFLAHRIIEKCSKISFVNEKLYYYIQREGSITHSSSVRREFDALEAYTDRWFFFRDKGFVKYRKLSEKYITWKYNDILANYSHPIPLKIRKKIKPILLDMKGNNLKAYCFYLFPHFYMKVEKYILN